MQICVSCCPYPARTFEHTPPQTPPPRPPPPMQHTIGAHYRHAGVATSVATATERHLELGQPGEFGGAAPVRMANASTNTPRRLAGGSMTMAAQNATMGQQQQQSIGSYDTGHSGDARGPPRQQQPDWATGVSYEPAPQPKKRGPKVGSRRTRSIAPDDCKPQQRRQSSAGLRHGQSGWQHDPLPAPVEKCSAAEARTAGGATAGAAQQHDPYAFHCDSGGYQDNGMDCAQMGNSRRAQVSSGIPLPSSVRDWCRACRRPTLSLKKPLSFRCGPDFQS